MSVVITAFDTLPCGCPVEKITLQNSSGTVVSVLSYGVTVQSLLFDDKDIVLGFDTIAEYLQSDAYMGATVGRVCNRIADGRFELNGQVYQLACNESERRVHLHGGVKGFADRIWDYTVLTEEVDPSVVFSLHSADGEEGYPGNLDVSVTLTLTQDDTLIFAYEGKSDKDTPLNLTNHTYFNLNGCDGEDVKNTVFRIQAEEYTPVTERLIPTGEYASVEGTPLDFRNYKPLREALYSDHPVVAPVGGIDHNFVLAHERRPLSEAVCAYSPNTRIRLTCATDLPGVQIYTANATAEPGGKYGLCWGKHQGFCIETQYFPDSVNQPAFPSIILPAGETYSSCTTIHLDHIEE